MEENYSHDEIILQNKEEEDLTDYFKTQIALSLGKHFENDEKLLWELLDKYKVIVIKK